MAAHGVLSYQAPRGFPRGPHSRLIYYFFFGGTKSWPSGGLEGSAGS